MLRRASYQIPQYKPDKNRKTTDKAVVFFFHFIQSSVLTKTPFSKIPVYVRPLGQVYVP